MTDRPSGMRVLLSVTINFIYFVMASEALKEKLPHSKICTCGSSRRHRCPLKIKPKIILLSYSLGPQFSGICTWKFSNTFEVQDLRFFWLLRVHGSVDLNICRIVDFSPLLSVTGKAPVLQVSIMSEPYCSNDPFPPVHWLFEICSDIEEGFLHLLSVIRYIGGTMEKQTFKNLHICSFFQWKR